MADSVTKLNYHSVALERNKHNETLLRRLESCDADRAQLFKKSNGTMSWPFSGMYQKNILTEYRKKHGIKEKKQQAPSGPSSPEMVNNGNIGWQQPSNHMMNTQSWPIYGHRQFNQPGYGYPPGYWSYQPMNWNRPMYGQSPFYQPPPYMYGKK